MLRVVHPCSALAAGSRPHPPPSPSTSPEACSSSHGGHADHHAQHQHRAATQQQQLHYTRASAIERRPRVLVVDDVAVNRLVLSKMLRKLGFDVLEASSGQQCLDLCHQLHDDLDCVLLDLHMPVMDGWATALQVRAWERGCLAPRGLPLLACTAECLSTRSASGTTVAEEAFLCGMNECITKPPKLSDLRDMLAKYVPVLREQQPQHTASQAAPVAPPAPQPAAPHDQHAQQQAQLHVQQHMQQHAQRPESGSCSGVAPASSAAPFEGSSRMAGLALQPATASCSGGGAPAAPPKWQLQRNGSSGSFGDRHASLAALAAAAGSKVLQQMAGQAQDAEAYGVFTLVRVPSNANVV